LIEGAFDVARILRILTVLILLMLPLVAVATQNSSAQVETPTPTPTFDPFYTPSPTFDPFATPTLDPAFIDPENTPEPTPFPSATPVIPAESFILIDSRKDMELLANEQLGFGTRPPGWNGEVSPYDTQLALLTRADLELLATVLINPDRRPPRWTGAVASTPFAVARDVRYDLEILADLLYGSDAAGRSIRPAGWLGGDPLYKCNRATQTLVSLLERGGLYRLGIDANDPDFCRKVEQEVSVFTEQELLANTQIGNLFSDQLPLLSEHQIDSNIAVAFLDSAARGRLGVIPNGTPVQVIARSYENFSNMMLVQGDNFTVFVEYTNTTVTPEQFRALPNVASLQVETGCFANWCNTN
jgi:hypothetical protein